MIRNFLSLAAKAAVSTGKKSTVVVLGNESCDLDSAASAIAYAFFLAQVLEPKQTVIPVLNVRQKHYHIKTEVDYALKRFVDKNIESELVFTDSLDLNALSSGSLLNLHLVDHNALASHQKSLAKSVVKIIDHHAIVPETISVLDNHIEKVGSCCSLVAEYAFVAKLKDFPRELAYLLLSTILVDTNGLKEGIDKTTPKDKEMVRKLEEEILGLTWDTEKQLEKFRKKLRRDILDAKSDVSHLSPLDLLFKDAKISRISGANILMSTLPIEWDEFEEKVQSAEELVNVVQEAAKQTETDMVVIYTVWSSINNGRELVFYCEDDQKRETAIQALKNSPAQLEQADLGKFSTPKVEAYIQRNRSMTRKQVQPLLEQTFSK